jgi:hypothetical protein
MFVVGASDGSIEGGSSLVRLAFGGFEPRASFEDSSERIGHRLVAFSPLSFPPLATGNARVDKRAHWQED